MLNAEKIQILKDNITKFIIYSKNIDEKYIFDYAKQQAKDMQIEISKGAIKSLIYDIINSNSINLN